MTHFRGLWLVLVVAALLPGCALWNKVSGKERRSQEQARRIEQIQQTCQRYADGYAGKILESVVPLAKQARDPLLVNRLNYWQLSQVNSAYTIATGPSPVLCQLDFVVLATLSRIVVEKTLVETGGDLMQALPPIYRDLEREAWANVAEILTPEQLQELRDLIVAWQARNPDVMLVGFVHFSEFAQAAGWSPQAASSPGSVFGLLGLDPLAGLDPAIKQIEQTRLLAERMIFYMQRMPYLIDLQANRTISQATLAPQVERANASLERASLAMEGYAQLGADLPAALARERDALIRQLSGELLAQEADLRDLLAQMQTTLVAGSQTATAVDSAVVALDRLVARFPRREPGAGAGAGKPFDINEYTRAATEFTGTARQLTGLIEALGRGGEPMSAAVAGSVDAGRGLVDHLFKRALQLGLLLIAAGLAAAFAYRALVARFGRPGPGTAG